MNLHEETLDIYLLSCRWALPLPRPKDEQTSNLLKHMNFYTEISCYFQFGEKLPAHTASTEEKKKRSGHIPVYFFFLSSFICDFPLQLYALVGGLNNPQQSFGQTVVTGAVPFPPRYASLHFCRAYDRFQRSCCWSITMESCHRNVTASVPILPSTFKREADAVSSNLMLLILTKPL